MARAVAGGIQHGRGGDRRDPRRARHPERTLVAAFAVAHARPSVRARRRILDARTRSRVVRRRSVGRARPCQSGRQRHRRHHRHRDRGGAVDRSADGLVLLGDVAFLHDTTTSSASCSETSTSRSSSSTTTGEGSSRSSRRRARSRPERFEQLFGTPHGVNPASLAAAHEISSVIVEDPAAFAPATESAKGVSLVVVRTDRAENVKIHVRAQRRGRLRASGANEG